MEKYLAPYSFKNTFRHIFPDSVSDFGTIGNVNMNLKPTSRFVTIHKYVLLYTHVVGTGTR